VALLNSSLLQQSPGSFQGHGFVGDPQLRHVAQEMGWNKPAEGGRAFRVLVVHHHLLPVTFREDPVDGRLYSIALDAEAIMRWIVKHRVDVVLHGHMHQPFYVTITRPETPQAGTPHTFAVFGAGSAGVEASHLGEPRRNMFATLTFSSEAVTVTARSVDSANPSEELWSVRHPVKRN